MALKHSTQIQSQPQKAEIYIKLSVVRRNPETDLMEEIILPGILFLNSEFKNKIMGDGEFQRLLKKGNALQEYLIAQGKEKLAPGESKEIPMKVSLCRRKAETSSKDEVIDFNLL